MWTHQIGKEDAASVRHSTLTERFLRLIVSLHSVRLLARSVDVPFLFVSAASLLAGSDEDAVSTDTGTDTNTSASAWSKHGSSTLLQQRTVPLSAPFRRVIEQVNARGSRCVLALLDLELLVPRRRYI